ncbi:MAG: response regulator [Acidobacteriota bacterium]
MFKKVLVCDDEPYILESVSYVARKVGCEVYTAEDGVEALDVARAQRPDLIVLDLMMPGKTGFQVCRELREDPELKGSYVIILTARGQESDQEEALKAGADEYLTKPFSPRALQQKIRDALSRES